MFQLIYLIDKPLAECWGDPFLCMNATIHKNSLSSFILFPNLLKNKFEILFYMNLHTDLLLSKYSFIVSEQFFHLSSVE